MDRLIVVHHEFFEPELIGRITERAAELGFRVLAFDGRVPGEKEKGRDAVKDAEILYAFSPRMLRAGSEKLKWFCCMSAGVDLFTDPSVFPNPGVMLTNSNVYGPAIAEHVVMALLMMMRKMNAYGEIVRERKWTRNLPIDGIIENSFLIVGTGNLGTNIASRLKGMRAGRVIGVNRSGVFRGEEDPFDAIHPIGELDGLLGEAGAVILAVPKLGDTTRIINAGTIARMRDGAYLVNVGRGNAVDQAALIEALNGGKLAGAALDVFETEPVPPDDPIWDAKNILITPHVSGDTSLPYTRRANVERFLADLERYAKGEPLLGLVDPKRGY